MTIDPEDTILEIVNDLEDLKTTIEELMLDPPEGIDRTSLERLRTILEQASAVAEELEEQDERRRGLRQARERAPRSRV